METKKTSKANIEQMRFPILLTGLLFTGSIVLASFSYTTGTERESNEKTSLNATQIDFVQADRPEPQQPEQQEITLPPDEKIIIDSSEVIIIPDPVVVLPPPPDIKKGPEVIIPPEPPILYPDVEATFTPVNDFSPAVAMQKWIAENVQYPQTSIEMNEQGRVYMSFTVEKDGSISEIIVERGVSPDIDREAKRLLRNMPKWVAGEVKGLKVRTRCQLPINFTLN